MKGIKSYKNKYVAYISGWPKQIYVGYYDDINEAIKKRDEKIVELCLDFSRLNKPELYEKQTKKYCSGCKNVCDLQEFTNSRGVRKFRHCKQCRNVGKNPKQTRSLIDYRNKGIKEYFKCRLSNIKRRCKITGRIFDLHIDDILNMFLNQEEKCAICGDQMTHQAGYGRKPSVVSVDRIDSSKGYVKENVWLTCDRCNRFKQSYSMKDLVDLCSKIVEHQSLPNQ